MNQSNKSISWSLGVIVISFCICFTIMYFSKFNCVTTQVSKSKTKVDIGKVSSISSIISICLGICVFIFLLEKDSIVQDSSTTGVVFVNNTSPSVHNNYWSDPI